MFCNYNPLYLQVLSILESEIMPLVLINNKKKNPKTDFKWKNIADWMEKVCV